MREAGRKGSERLMELTLRDGEQKLAVKWSRMQGFVRVGIEERAVLRVVE